MEREDGDESWLQNSSFAELVGVGEGRKEEENENRRRRKKKKKRKKIKERDEDAGERPFASSSETARPDGIDGDTFYFDRTGDGNNLQYQRLYKMDVAQYRRSVDVGAVATTSEPAYRGPHRVWTVGGGVQVVSGAEPLRAKVSR